VADGGSEQAVVHLSLGDAAILAAALRQYEPYRRPGEADHGEELSALVRDITRFAGRVAVPGAGGPLRTAGDCPDHL